MDKKEEFLKKLLVTFRIEAEENLTNMSANLIKLEKKPSDSHSAELIEIIFRQAHSLKGASRAVNLSEIESVCQSFESVMSALKNKIIQLNPKIFDVLQQTVDIINDLLNSSEERINSELKNRISDVLRNLSMVEAGKSEEIEIKKSEPKTTTLAEPVSEKEKKDAVSDIKKEETVISSINKKSAVTSEKETVLSTKKPSAETIRVSIKKLDKLLFQAEEMLLLKLTSTQQIENLRLAQDKLTIWKKESVEVFSSVRNIKQIFEKKEKEGTLPKEEQDIIKIIQFYEWSVSHIKMLEDELIELRNFSDQQAYSSSAKIEALLDDVKEIITVPFSMLLDVFPKAVRDISKDIGKEVDFVVIGEDTEIDRRILEDIRQPLMHILRNCIDYGIEKPDVRIKKNKPPKGTITFNVKRLENNKILVQISDDGAGINIEKLRNLYIKNEKVSAEEAAKIQKKELLYYIFKSGVSTSDMVTDISGRGLGLAIVQENIEQLGGAIIIESEKDKGTTLNLELPLSLVTFRGVIIKVSDREFVVPTAKIQRVLRLNRKEVKTVENRATMTLDGHVIPFVSLSSILELPIKENDSEYVQTLIFGSKNKKISFAIDEIVNEQEVLVKNFNKHLARVRNISGATVLGSGKVVPILNISDLLKSALKPMAIAIKQKASEETEEVKKSVLVVEDSITSRMLLKNILETAGYVVTTAIDGIDGFTKLKESNFNAVVSDIEMPRMNGFDLTAKIRSDKVLSEMPVLLVTSLSKREDRERGIDVGANAYIIKSSFDQSNLLEILERLI